MQAGVPHEATLQSKIEAAEGAGCPEGLLQEARQLLWQVQVKEARGMLEAALRPRGGGVAAAPQRSAALQVRRTNHKKL